MKSRRRTSLAGFWRAVGAFLVLAAALVAACDSSRGAGWTYAPLGPSAPAGGSPSAGPSRTPGAGLNIDIQTPADQPLAFVPNMLNAPPATLVTVNYLNHSTIEHNINFFNGPDQNSPSLGATPRTTGPNAFDSVTFTTPNQPGDYYFWCDVHFQAMSGTLHIAP